VSIPHVTVDSNDPYERGRQRGAQVADRLRATWPMYQRLFAETADYAGRPPVDVAAVAVGCLDELRSWSPDLLREAEGIADATDLDLADVMALNARTEVLASARGVGPTECSTLVQLAGAGGTALSAQTWDWHHDLADGWHTQAVRGDEHAYVGLAEFGMMAKIGVNDAGVGLHLNLLRHASDLVDADDARAPVGIPVHLLARQVLSHAGTLDEAIEILRTAPAAGSSVLTVVTPHAAACVEISPAAVAVVEPSDGWLVHTNHFLDPGLAAGERVTLDITTTFERQDALRSRVKGVAGPIDVEGVAQLLCMHDDNGVAVCRHLDESAPFGFRSATLATVGLDPHGCTATLSAWGPCRRDEVVTLVAGD
jgi:isopenicillin-N N-acyltransferase-like protein